MKQHDPYGRHLTWRQHLDIAFIDSLTGAKTLKTISMDGETQHLNIPAGTAYIIPNYSGKGYGRFLSEEEDVAWELNHWYEVEEETSRLSMLMNINESRLLHQLPIARCYDSYVEGLRQERNPLIASLCASYATSAINYCAGEERQRMERELWKLSQNHPVASVRQRLMRLLCGIATDNDVTEAIHHKWESCDDSLLNESDYISMSYQLALRKPEAWQDITTCQRNRISSADRIREYEYVSRGCSPDTAVRAQLFLSLLEKENRQVEPWAESLLRLLNSPLRQSHSIKYISPALDALEDIQRTSDIFFPKKWCNALLSGHYSREAFEKVRQYLAVHPQLSVPLKNKLLQTTEHLNYLYGTFEESGSLKQSE